MNMQTIEVTGREPVTLDEAKTHLRISFSDDDTYISGLITLAREYCENFTSRSFVSCTYLLSLPVFPYLDKPITLPFPPLKEVDWVVYKDSDGILRTLTENNDYLIITNITPGVIVPVPNTTWTVELYDVPDAVQIQYKTEPDKIPLSVKQAMLLLIGHYYENRELSTDRRINEIPMSVHSLLWPYRLVKF